jgi:hypothetical protein
VLRDDAWATAAILDAPVAEPAIAMLPDDDLVVMDRASGRLERVRLRTGEASRLPSLPAAGCGFAALDGTLYVVGGTQGRADLDGVWAMTIVDRLRVFRQLPRAFADAREGAHDTPLRGR